MTGTEYLYWYCQLTLQGYSSEEAKRIIETEKNKIICSEEGHDWAVYSVSTGYEGNEVEQAGLCKRCGYDTHAEVAE